MGNKKTAEITFLYRANFLAWRSRLIFILSPPADVYKPDCGKNS